jgi:hypothetical protein
MRRALMLLLLVVPTPAAADDWSAHILANGRVGWTDNLHSAEDETSSPPKEGDIYTTIAPGLLLTLTSPRTVNQFEVGLDTNVYYEHDEGWSYIWHGGWRGFYLTSPLSELQASVLASGGTMNTFSTYTPASMGQTGLIPSQQTSFTSVEASEGYGLQLSRPWRWTQNAFASVFRTESGEMDFVNTGYRVGLGTGLDRTWQFNALMARTEGSYDVLGEGASQLTTNGSLAWRRDIGLRWSSSIDAGVVAIIPLEEGQYTAVQPTIGAQVGYYPTWGTAGLSVRRTVAPNLAIASNTINDAATLNAWLPIPWFAIDPNGQPRITFEASGGFGFTRILDTTTDDTTSAYRVAMGTVAINYALKPQVSLGLRYQYEHQTVDESTLVVPVSSFTRNTVLFSFSGRWPERTAGDMPTRSSMRVDRSNVTPVGEEATTPIR